MFNFTLYRREMKGSLKMLGIFALVLTLYVSMVIVMFDPETQDMIAQFFANMPEVAAAMGFSGGYTTLIGFLSSFLYGFILIAFPMVFSILCGNKLIARYVDRGSMVSLLAAPVRRSTVAFTQMKVLVTGIVLLILYATLLEVLVCQISFPGELDIGRLLLLNTGLLCLHLFIGGICFFSSCLFSDAKYSIGLGAGLPAFMFLLQMLGNAGDAAEGIKYVTFFTLFRPDGIIALDGGAITGMILLFVGALALFIAGIAVFTQKDLSI